MLRHFWKFFKKEQQPLRLSATSFHSYDMEKEIPPSLEDIRKKDMPISVEKNPFEKEKMKCVLCKYDVQLDYKNVRLLSQFVSAFSGKVYGRHVTGICEKQQDRLKKAVAKARACGLMPYYYKDPIYLKDPTLFDPERPFRPHKY